MVTRGRLATFPLPGAGSPQEVVAAADALRTGLAQDDLHVIASPGGAAQASRLIVLRLIDEDEARRLRDRLMALVAEFRELAHRLIVPFRLQVEPAYEHGAWYPERLDVDGETWSLDVHGEHCHFTGLTSGREVDVHIYSPEKIDPLFLLQYAESTARHAEIRTACVAEFHDMCRLLDLAGVPC